MERIPFDFELFDAKKLYTEEARKKFVILRAFAAEFLNLQIALVEPGFVNYSIENSPYDVSGGVLVRKTEK